MTAIADASRDRLGGDPDAVIRELYSHYAKALHGYVEQFCPDRASADDIVKETFIRAWRHLPQLSADDRPVRPWLFRVARNLLIDANRAARSRPMTVPGQPDGEVATDSGLEEILDHQFVSAVLQHLSPAPAPPEDVARSGTSLVEQVRVVSRNFLSPGEMPCPSILLALQRSTK